VINVALIGHGYWGTKLEKYILENPDFDLKYVCDSKSDLELVWADKEVTAAVIAVRNEQRYPITRDALLAGKHVLSEKPLALTLTEANDLARLSREQGVVLVVDYTFTFSKSLKMATEIVKSSQIGDLLGFVAQVNHLGKFGGGSVYTILGSHLLSVLGMFLTLGDLSFTKRDLVVVDGSVESGVINIGGSGVRGQVMLSLNYPSKTVEVVLYGSKGTIAYNPNKATPLVCRIYTRQTWVDGADLPGEIVTLQYDEANNLRYVIRYFHDVLNGSAETNLDTAVKITEILEELNSA